MRLDIPQQGEKGMVLLAVCRNLLGDLECLRVHAFAEIGVSQVELDVVRIGIRVHGRLEMLNGILVQTVACQQDSYPGLCPKVSGA